MKETDKSRTGRQDIRLTLKRLLNGSISPEKAQDQLRQGKGIVPTVIDWGDGTYTMGATSGMTEAEVLKAAGAKSIDEVIAIAFTKGQRA